MKRSILSNHADGYTVPGKDCMQITLRIEKQSPRCWNKAFHDYMEIGFKQSAVHVYIHKKKESTMTPCMHVNDLIIIPKQLTKWRKTLKTSSK